MIFNFKKYFLELLENDNKKEIANNFLKNYYNSDLNLIPEEIEDTIFYKEYLNQFNTIEEINTPSECRNDFDWLLLQKLAAGSFSAVVKVSFDSSLPEIEIQVSSNNISLVKKVSELWGFQIYKLYEIFVEELLNIQNLLISDEKESKTIKTHRNFKIENWNYSIQKLNSNTQFKILKPKKNKEVKSEVTDNFVINKNEWKTFESSVKENPKDSEKIYHYTSLQSAIKILTSGKILATDIGFLNDPDEEGFSYNFFIRILNEIKKDSWGKEKLNDFGIISELEKNLNILNPKSTRLVSCFSYSRFSLPQWLIYADKGEGVCIEFDKNLLDRNISELNSEIQIKFDNIKYYSPFQYYSKIIKEELKDLRNDFFESEKNNDKVDVSDRIKKYLLNKYEELQFCKYNSYSFENEYRYLIDLNINELVKPKLQWHREKYAKKVLELNIWRSLETIKTETPISSIIIGPCSNIDLTRKSLKEIIINENIEPFDINTNCEINYRQ